MVTKKRGTGGFLHRKPLPRSTAYSAVINITNKAIRWSDWGKIQKTVDEPSVNVIRVLVHKNLII
jgi:hypothetical protein